MKVIAFNGSPHEDGTVHAAIRLAAGEMEKAGIEVETVQVGGKAIRGCVACYECRRLKRCVFNDDLVNGCREKAVAADGLIVASPVYYGAVAGTMKCFLDRLFFPGPDLRFKAAAAIVALRRSGGVPAFQQLCSYFNLAQMVIVPTQYWSAIHGTNAEESAQDLEGTQNLRLVGRNMAWLVKTLAAGRAAVPPPVPEERVRTNFVR